VIGDPVHGDRQVVEARLAEQRRDQRHDEVLDEGVDDARESRADGHADREVDEVAREREVPELREEPAHPTHLPVPPARAAGL
jgi:hypothetical protein